MLDMTKLNNLIPDWMTLMFTQGHRITLKLELCIHFVVKWYEATQLFMMVDYVKDYCEEIPYNKYGLFEHLLFLILLQVCIWLN